MFISNLIFGLFIVGIIVFLISTLIIFGFASYFLNNLSNLNSGKKPLIDVNSKFSDILLKILVSTMLSSGLISLISYICMHVNLHLMLW